MVSIASTAIGMLGLLNAVVDILPCQVDVKHIHCTCLYILQYPVIIWATSSSDYLKYRNVFLMTFGIMELMQDSWY